MEFTEYAQKIKPIIGGSYSTHVFTRTLFESIITEEGLLQIEDISENTFKAYYNGQTKITKISQRILPHIDPEQFIAYLDGFPEATTQRLCDTFESDIEGVDLYNAAEKIAYYFEKILTTAATQKRKSTPKSADKTPHDILEEKILASGQAVADAWGNSVSNLVNGLDGNSNAGTTSVQLPEEQPNESLYSSEDNLLLEEFTADYDEIMVILIGENYAASLIDMTLPCKIKGLYETKWMSKADTFADPSLKSYVFGLLGELNNISNSFLVSGSATPFLGSSRTKIRNLYVKLHPDQFAGTFPYDAFIDDWDDGEYF